MGLRKKADKEKKKTRTGTSNNEDNTIIILYVFGGFVTILAIAAGILMTFGAGAPTQEAIGLSDMAIKYIKLNNINAAITNLEKAIDISDYGKFRFQLGIAYSTLGNNDRALENYKRCVSLPASGHKHMCYNNMGVILQQKGLLNDAVNAYKKAIHKGWAQPMINAGKVYWIMDDWENAVKYYKQAYVTDRIDEVYLHVATLLPKIYTSFEQLKFHHKYYVEQVDKMWQWKTIKFREPLRLFETVFPYYLSYHGQNDVETYKKIGNIIGRGDPSLYYTAPHVKQALTLSQLPAAARSVGEKIRIGFSSLYFRTHASAMMIRGIIETIDHTKFHIIVFALRESTDPPNPYPANDPVAMAIKKAAHKYVDLPKTSLDDMRRTMGREKLDVMIWAEIGMDPANYLLSFGKLAPVSIATHGHASTTGVPSIDYYVTYRLFEIQSAQNHYSEKLVTLPGFSRFTHLIWQNGQERIWAYWMLLIGGLSGYPHIYSCTQTLWKFTPDFDEVFRQILLKDPKGYRDKHKTNKGLYLQYGGRGAEYLGNKTRQRFQTTLSGVFHRVIIINALDDSQYMALQKTVDVVLDSYPFGGYTTSLECFSLGTPVVTLPHPLFAGRCTYGFYKLMGITGLVAQTREEFVDIAVKYGTNNTLNQLTRKKILASNHVLFNNQSAISAWDQLLVEVSTGSNVSFLHVNADKSEFEEDINGDWPAA